MKYTLGLDLGIASIGWAVFNHDINTIEKCGVRLFEAAENPKTKESLALPRRLARGQRRRIRRRAFRMQSVRRLLIKHQLITQDGLDNLFQQKLQTNSNQSHYDIYELRYIALDSLLSNEQLCQILIYLAKHRGFKSNRKKDKSLDGTVNKSLQENQQRLKDGAYRSIGEMLYRDQEFSANKRNRFGEYRVMLQRSDLEKEAQLILQTQLNLGNTCINDSFIEQYTKVFNQQKSFDWNDDIIQMVGKCQFEKDELRAPKACFSSEKFIALSKLNNILIRNINSNIERKLSPAEIQQIIDFTLAKTVKSAPKINFGNLRDILSLHDEDERFNFVRYKSDQDFYEQEKNEQIRELSFPATHELKYAIVNNLGEITWNNLLNNYHLLDQICTDLTYNKTDDKIIEALQKTFTDLNHKFSLDEQKDIQNIIIDNGIGFEKILICHLRFCIKLFHTLNLVICTIKHAIWQDIIIVNKKQKNITSYHQFKPLVLIKN